MGSDFSKYLKYNDKILLDYINYFIIIGNYITLSILSYFMDTQDFNKHIINQFFLAASSNDANSLYAILYLNNYIHIKKEIIPQNKDTLNAFINQKDLHGNTALMLAAKNNGVACVKMLLGFEADCSIKNTNGFNALMLAAMGKHGNSAEIIGLLENKIDINLTNNQGQTALMLAAKAQSIPNVEKLLDLNASIDLQDTSGLSALMYAAEGRTPKTIELLLRHKANIHLTNKDGQTALTLASSNTDSSKEVQNLLSKAYNDNVSGSMENISQGKNVAIARNITEEKNDAPSDDSPSIINTENKNLNSP